MKKQDLKIKLNDRLSILSIEYLQKERSIRVEFEFMGGSGFTEGFQFFHVQQQLNRFEIEIDVSNPELYTFRKDLIGIASFDEIKQRLIECRELGMIYNTELKIFTFPGFDDGIDRQSFFMEFRNDKGYFNSLLAGLISKRDEFLKSTIE